MVVEEKVEESEAEMDQIYSLMSHDDINPVFLDTYRGVHVEIRICIIQ